MPQPLIDRFGASIHTIKNIVQDSLHQAEDGELYLEYREDEALLFDNQYLKSGSFNQDCGFGLRAVSGETTRYAHASEFSLDALKKAQKIVSTHGQNSCKKECLTASKPKHQLYKSINPLHYPSFETKVLLLQKIDQYLRNQHEAVRQVTIALFGSMQHVEIVRQEDELLTDIRPLVRLSISIVVAKGDRQEKGFYGYGGRESFEEFLAENKWKHAADEALRMGLVNLEAEPAPAGVFDIVLANGWPGVMIHEAVGHGLEGDFNHKKTSAFCELMGQQVAAKGVTIVDDGSIEKKRGSLNIDDEGTPTQRNILIEDGKLVGHMHDRLSARLMGQKLTGNGRRESYAYMPLPRMTNTFMLSGKETPQSILSSMKNGIYAVSFGGGQVDITSGEFVFECTEAYRIENGTIGAPIKDATLIGNGPDIMKNIVMLGNDSKLDNGIGMCGKAGQNVPVGVGQPHLRVQNVTIGGTAIAS